MELINSISTMSIYHKLLQVQKAVSALAKDKSGNSYQYVSGDKLLGIVRPTMDNLGLLLVPEVVDASFTRMDYNLYDKNGNPRPKSEMFCALKLKFTWVDADNGETLVCFWESSGQNNWDKGLGSALTYGERYFLLKFFHIATDKDDVDAPKTEEEEATVQSAIANINACTDASTAMQWLEYYKQFPKIGRDKEFLKAYNKKMQELNGTENQQ